MAKMIGGDRPLRGCANCGQVDDHPRCSVLMSADPAIWADWHNDCHFNVMGPMTCHAHCDGSHVGKTGAAMLKHILDFHKE
jgi:hypothetical protein